MKKEDLQKFITGADKTNITEKMLALPSYFFDMVYEIELLENEYRVQDHALEVAKSKIYRSLSITYKNVKSVTPTTLNHHINCEPDIVTKTQSLLVLAKRIGVLKAKVKTINIFSEMLTNVGHNFRKERENTKKGV